MKKILVILSCILASAMMSAQDQVKDAFFVQFKDGSTNAFLFSRKPIITMEGENMLITVANEVELNVKRSEIEKCFFGNSVGIQAVDNNGTAFFYRDGQTVRITGLKTNTIVSVTSLDGKKISSQRCDSFGNATISMASLPKGLYIVSYGDRSVKITR